MRTNSNITSQLSKQLEKNYPLFSDYCNYLENGLRKEAFKCLDKFLDITKNWEHSSKSDFCKQLFDSLTDTNCGLDIILTTKLTDILIKPTLLRMTNEEPDNYLPFKWYGQYFRDTQFIKKAYKLKPSDNAIKLILLERLEKDLWLSTHHLPDGYIGNIEDDELDINLAFSVLESLKPTTQDNFTALFSDFKSAIDKYK